MSESNDVEKAMSVSAVFVDATGHTRDMVLKQPYPQYRFAIPRPMSVSFDPDKRASMAIAVPLATFQRIGLLSDDRVVYGQAEARLTLWTLDIDVMYEVQKLALVDIALTQCNHWMNHCVGRPVLCLLHKQRADNQRGLHHHRFEGVGRQMPEPDSQSSWV